jgi:predicted deacetylase
MHPSEPQRLLASIHDVSPRFEREVSALHDRLAGHLGGQRLAMLVVPDHWGEAPLSAAPAFRARLRAWAEAGIEMFVHGWYHRDDSQRRSFKARHMTAGEGEFSALDRDTALDRMMRGRAIVEDATGMPAAGFIAPAWLYSRDSRTALGDADFALAEDHMSVWRPSDGMKLARGPVITWASRSPARIASSTLFAQVAPTLLRPLPIVRVAVHPGDTTVPALLRSIDRTFASLLGTGRVPARYRDLLPHR